MDKMYKHTQPYSSTLTFTHAHNIGPLFLDIAKLGKFDTFKKNNSFVIHKRASRE